MINKLKSLKNHQGFMKYFKNTSWLFGEKILRMVVGLFTAFATLMITGIISIKFISARSFI